MSNDNKVDYLKKSLIYQMSLGSKELFHSNVWNWLIVNDKEFIKVFIPDFDLTSYNNGKTLWPKREEKNRDILIWCEDNNKCKYHIVIENKIKTLPLIEQLEKYTVPINDSPFYKGILTGIGACTIDFDSSEKLKGKWSYVNYEDISKRIKSILENSKVDVITNHKSQILEYCDVIDAINTILSDEINKNKNILTFKHDKTLEDLRIDDVYKKYKASQFVQYLKSRKSELDQYKPSGFNLYISPDFYDKKAVIDIRFNNRDLAKDDYIILGVQIEEDQFRIVIQRNLQRVGITSDDLFNEYNGDWFDSSYDRNTNLNIYKHKTSMKPRSGKQYDKYNSNDYCFIYQYFNIDDTNNSYDTLFNLIKEFIIRGSNILKMKC